MVILKKLAFAPFFIISFGLLIYQFAPILKSYDFIFSPPAGRAGLSAETFIGLIIISAQVALTSYLFILFATLAFDFKIVLPVGLISPVVVLILIPSALGLILAVTCFVSFLLTYFSLETTLKSYLNFQPANLLGPSIRHLSGLLILCFCLIYFFSASKLISQNGFQIPDSLIETALKFTAPSTASNITSTPPISIPADQLDLLKNNPDLLKQYELEGIQTVTELSNDLIKQTVKDQVQGFIKPYLTFIPAILTLMLFFTLQSTTSIISLLIHPLLWITFLILEKSGFITFTTEMREVKKMVI